MRPLGAATALGEGTPVTGIDHLLVGVADLEAARAAWLRLGFSVTPRGRHIGRGTANYCIMFPRDYVELLGVIDPTQVSGDLGAFLGKREGLLGLAFATRDAGAAAQRLRAAGIAAEDPRDLTRLLELPDGEQRPAFQLVQLPPDATPGIHSFVCQHRTPELVWQAGWSRHPNGATGLLSLTAVVEDPAIVAVPYGELFGFDRVLVRDGFVTVQTGTGELHFTDSENLSRLHPGLTRYPAHPAPWLAAMRIAVPDPVSTAHYLARVRLPFYHGENGSLTVAPSEANGVILEFARIDA